MRGVGVLSLVLYTERQRERVFFFSLSFSTVLGVSNMIFLAEHFFFFSPSSPSFFLASESDGFFLRRSFYYYYAYACFSLLALALTRLSTKNDEDGENHRQKRKDDDALRTHLHTHGTPSYHPVDCLENEQQKTKFF